MTKQQRKWVPKDKRPVITPRSPLSASLRQLGHPVIRNHKRYSRKGRSK